MTDAELNAQAVEEKCKKLRDFFPPDVVGFDCKDSVSTKPGEMVLCLPFPGQVAVQDRLDDVLGCDNWSEDYANPGEFTRCVLSVRFLPDGEWVRRVGLSSSKEPERAHAEALRDAARKLGIGRYLTLYPQHAKHRGFPNGLETRPALPDAALPEEYRKCGREYGQKVRALIRQVCERSREKGRPVDEKLAAAKLVGRHGVSPDAEGNVNLATLPRRTAGAVLNQVNAWLAELEGNNPNPPSSPFFQADQAPRKEESQKNPPQTNGAQSPQEQGKAPTQG